MRLVRDLGDLDADRQLGLDRSHGLREIGAERDDIGAFLHRHVDPDCRPAPSPTSKLGGVFVAALDARDVAEAEHASIDLHGNGLDGVGSA